MNVSKAEWKVFCEPCDDFNLFLVQVETNGLSFRNVWDMVMLPDAVYPYSMGAGHCIGQGAGGLGQI